MTKSRFAPIQKKLPKKMADSVDFFHKFWNTLSVVRKALVALSVLLFVTALVLVVMFVADLPSPTKLQSSENLAVSTKILDRNGELLYEIFADENRTPVSLDSLPPYIAQASVAIEDKHFYSHFGIDFTGIIRAVVNNLIHKQGLQGGSTITQQLIKVSLLSRERTIKRKIKEAILTLATEVMYSKKKILEMYLNHVPYGGTAWGIEAAAQTYFNKPAKELTLAEAAYLAGLPQSPSRYSPYGNTPERGRERQKEVLRRMVEDKYISQSDAENAQKQELKFAEKRFDIKAPHFVMYVRDQLVEEYGQAVVERGGLRVTTTLDLELQNAAQASLSAEITKLQKYRVGNGSALVTRASTGEVLAMVGSRDYFNATSEGQINMTVRNRQPGSSFKPLNLATALQLRRVNMNTVLLDIPTCFQLIGQSDYCPRNYDGNYHGPVTLRQGLANSYNIPAVKIGALNGLENFIATASAMGISTLKEVKDYGPSLPLGAAEVTMIDMTTAFGTFANQGVKVPPIGILKIEDYTGKKIYEADLKKRQEAIEAISFLTLKTPAPLRPIPSLHIDTNKDAIYRVLDPEIAYIMSDILSDNNARSAAFGTRSELYIPNFKVAAKTGTTNDLRDNWTIGFTPDFVTAVWVGNTDNSQMNPYLVSGVTGAAPIWNDIMSHLLKDYGPRHGISTPWQARPATVTDTSFCKRSGDLPNPATPADHQCEMTSEIFFAGTEPQASENVWRSTWVAGQTGLPPSPTDPTDQLTFEEHTLLTDPFTRDYCLDCVRKPPALPEGADPNTKPEIWERYNVTAERLFELEYGFQGWRE